MKGGTANPSQEFLSGRHVLVLGNTGFRVVRLGLWPQRLGAKVMAERLPPPPTEPSLFALAGFADLEPSGHGDCHLSRATATLPHGELHLHV
jgi:hypothetical protein